MLPSKPPTSVMRAPPRRASVSAVGRHLAAAPGDELRQARVFVRLVPQQHRPPLQGRVRRRGPAAVRGRRAPHRPRRVSIAARRRRNAGTRSAPSRGGCRSRGLRAGPVPAGAQWHPRVASFHPRSGDPRRGCRWTSVASMARMPMMTRTTRISISVMPRMARHGEATCIARGPQALTGGSSCRRRRRSLRRRARRRAPSEHRS